MPLPSSGTITLGNLQTEFGGSNPVDISEYYRGGGLVPNVSVNANVPTSGQISLSNFYGASNSDPNPDAFNIGNISFIGFDDDQANSNQVTISGITVPITLNFGTVDGEVNRTGGGFGAMTANVTIFVNGAVANSFTWARVTNGQTLNIVRDAKVTVSNTDTIIVGLAAGLGGESGVTTGGASANITVSNDSSGNASLDTFSVSAALEVS